MVENGCGTWLPAACRPTWTGRRCPTRRWVEASADHARRALGVAREQDIEQHFVRERYPGLTTAFAKLVADERVTKVTLEDDPIPWYVHADRTPPGDWSPRTTLLSPFDNLICDRARTERLWDFAFRTEMYVPRANRQYGYYVLPILHGDRLIGRVAPRLNRQGCARDRGRLFRTQCSGERRKGGQPRHHRARDVRRRDPCSTAQGRCPTGGAQLLPEIDVFLARLDHAWSVRFALP
ncbi:DNA glycosylase AlkZ-like family protein [Amycolatopsis sp. FDAARGOS 1241]|uniref:DNA glycosylase AlkZ-like family protein n=1 Tax=Amycolatopsis sp. FDAARGOS 1241 TaxID=2778070 RepID=UPI0019526E06|nr:crosslink repair DNA glycosylase YcaQ family protein [Amycolatopsis sp. FDAARGOS 1241]QRP47670.1 winged helix DNA-binding domain-containing protein [Amycolatopsis sp. FDAARGOS 1241]